MSETERVAAASSALKIFPLPSAVLFPHTAVPLHIFEERYREMVRDCLAGDRVMALGHLQPGWEPNYQGRPPLEPLCCAGFVAWHEELPDGRFNILVQGVVRARVSHELPPCKSYREVRAEVLPDPSYEGPEEEQLRQALLELASRVPDGSVNSLLAVASKASGGTLADLVAGSVVPDVDQRYALLRELDVQQRLRQVVAEVGALIGRLAPARPRGPLN